MKPVAIILGAVVLVLGVVVVAAVVVIPSCGGPAALSGTYTIDTVTFELDTARSTGGLSGAGPAADGPGIWIDTNIKLSGLYGGTVESRRPYAIPFDYTDNAADLATLEFTRVEVAYDDGSTEPAASALQMPLSVTPRETETVNSGAGGRIIRSTVRTFSGRIEGVVARDESFRLVMEGRFVKRDGSVVPFTIDQRWDVRVEQGTKPASEVLQDK